MERLDIIRLTRPVITASHGYLPIGAEGIVTDISARREGVWAIFHILDVSPTPETVIVFPTECKVIQYV